ncbi:MAG: L,D-transpeptidase family protein [Planctomycetota bacterium]
MQTLKTAIIVVLLLVVFYGVYEMLNSPPAEEPPEVANLSPDATAELDIDLGSEFGGPGSGSASSESWPSGPPPDPKSFGPSPPDPRDGEGGRSDQSEATSQADAGRSTPPSPTSGFQNPPRSSPETVSASNASPDRMDPPPGASGSFPSDSGPVRSGQGELSSNREEAETSATLSPPRMASAVPEASTSRVETSGGEVPEVPQLQRNPYIGEGGDRGASESGSADKELGVQAYQQARKEAESLIAEGDYHAALRTLSMFYKSPDLTADEHRELLDLLDPLAARVVYSREHVLEDPYKVGRNETLMDIAEQYNVPYQLLQKINAIEDPKVLLPGSELKVVSGPFRAEVDLSARELTVFLDRLYAGRFPVTLGADPRPVRGDFQVRDKQQDKTYFSLDGRTIPGDSPANPFGGLWVDLGREVCIHGSPRQGEDEKERGCISLSPQDADDVYSILSVGSKVRVLR